MKRGTEFWGRSGIFTRFELNSIITHGESYDVWCPHFVSLECSGSADASGLCLRWSWELRFFQQQFQQFLFNQLFQQFYVVELQFIQQLVVQFQQFFLVKFQQFVIQQLFVEQFELLRWW